MKNSFLNIKNLKTFFPLYHGIMFRKVTGLIKAVDEVSLSLEKGKVLGLVGESGCGKSTLGRSIMRLVNITDGSITLDNIGITELDKSKLVKIRPRMQMIFQDPFASLNPRMTIFDTIAEPLKCHNVVKRSELKQEISNLMKEVGLAPRFIKKYPHEFSGGQRQRIAIARALALRPDLIIADEPVSALDVSIQSQVLNLLIKLCRKRNLTMIFISHDLSVVHHIADYTAVMYLGKIVEYGTTQKVFQNPRHPYTKALLSAIPLPNPREEKIRKRIILEGDPPSPLNPPTGCRFHPRCNYAVASCSSQEQQLEPAFPDHEVACTRVHDIS